MSEARKQILKAQARSQKDLDREMVRLRKGVVTATAPLTVDLGDSGVPIEGVSAIGSVAVNDVVAVLVRNNSLVVLGRIGDGTDTSGDWEAALAAEELARANADLAILAVMATDTELAAEALARANADLAILAAVQPLDSDLTAIATLATTTFGRSLLTLANAAAARSTIGAAATSHTHAQADVTSLVVDLAAKQPLDSDLTAIAALSTTTFGRSLLTMADATAARSTLSLVIGTNVQAYDAELAAIAGLTSAADRLAYFTGSGTAALATFTAAGRALVDDADTTAQRATLGLVIGTNVAPVNSPAFTGDPTAPTPATSDNDTSIATTAFVYNTRVADGLVNSAAYRNVDAWQPLAEAPINYLTDAFSFNVWLFSGNGAAPVLSGFNFRTHAVWYTYINSADLGSTPFGKTLKYRLRAYAITNGTDPNQDIVFSLRPLTPSGGADALLMTAGAAVGNSATILNTNLNTNDQETAVSTSFTAPAAGFYGISVVPAGTIAADSTVSIGCRIEYRWE